MKDLFDLDGKVIVVTGATGVLAGGTAHYLQENGAKVVYLGRNHEKVDATLAKAQTISDECMGITADVMDETRLSVGYDEVMKKFDKIFK